MKFGLIVFILIFFLSNAQAQEEVNESQTNNSNPTRLDGFRFSGGLLGFAGSYRPELEGRFKQDAFLYFNQYNLDWDRYKRFRYFNPIGISYGSKNNLGTVFGFVETRGISGAENVTGFSSRNKYMSIGILSGTNTLNDNEINSSINDGGFGFQMIFDKFLVSPKISGRYFLTDISQNTIFNGNLNGVASFNIRTNSSSFFPGAKLQYLLAENSSLFLDVSTNKFTPVNGNETGSFHKISGFTNNTFYYTSATLSQQITSSRLLVGFQENFGRLGIQLGYQEEVISTRYTKFTSLPVVINGNNFNFNYNQFILDRFFIYKNSYNTDIKSFYINLIYAY